jgi:hypothetical protein
LGGKIAGYKIRIISQFAGDLLDLLPVSDEISGWPRKDLETVTFETFTPCAISESVTWRAFLNGVP